MGALRRRTSPEDLSMSQVRHLVDRYHLDTSREARMKGRQRDATDNVPVVGGSLLLGAARDLRRDLLGTFERAMHEYGGRPVRFRVGNSKGRVPGRSDI